MYARCEPSVPRGEQRPKTYCDVDPSAALAAKVSPETREKEGKSETVDSGVRVDGLVAPGRLFS